MRAPPPHCPCSPSPFATSPLPSLYHARFPCSAKKAGSDDEDEEEEGGASEEDKDAPLIAEKELEGLSAAAILGSADAGRTTRAQLRTQAKPGGGGGGGGAKPRKSGPVDEEAELSDF